MVITRCPQRIQQAKDSYDKQSPDRPTQYPEPPHQHCCLARHPGANVVATSGACQGAEPAHLHQLVALIQAELL